jgi:hypothetical protein
MPELTLTPFHITGFYSRKSTKNLDSGLTLYFSPKQQVGIGGGGGGVLYCFLVLPATLTASFFLGGGGGGDSCL